MFEVELPITPHLVARSMRILSLGSSAVVYDTLKAKVKFVCEFEAKLIFDCVPFPIGVLLMG